MMQKKLSRRNFLKIAGTGLAAGSLGSMSAFAEKLPTINYNLQNTTVKFWTWLNSGDAETSPRARAQQMILEAFRAANPDITVEEEVVPWQELHQQVLQSSMAGTAPDVSRMLDSYIYMLADAEAIAPLDPFIAGWDEARRSDYVYDWEDTTVNGQKFAFRQAIRPNNIIYYRTDLFADAGYDVPPPTLTEFTEAIQAVTQGDTIGFMLPYAKPNAPLITLQPAYWTLGSDLVDLETGEPTFHLEAGQKIHQWVQDLVTQGIMPAGVATMDTETVNNTFLGGTLATVPNHTSKWAEWSQVDILKDRIDTTWMPTFNDDPNVRTPAVTAGGWTLVMPTGAQNEAAWRLMEFMQSNEAELIDAEVGGELPTRLSTLENEYFQSEDAARKREWLEYMQESKHAATSLKISDWQLLNSVLSDAGQEIIINNADVAETLARAAEAYSAQRTT
jgi:multiple sugar transport system substrate-binding protein